MSEMVERVAMAIWVKRFPDSVHRTPEEMHPGLWEIMLNEARAALEAMREPTDAMIEAGNLNHPLHRSSWREAIDAALRD